jgi:hypothetical protein
MNLKYNIKSGEPTLQHKCEHIIEGALDIISNLNSIEPIVRYHSGGSMKLNACILHLVYMVYL